MIESLKWVSECDGYAAVRRERPGTDVEECGCAARLAGLSADAAAAAIRAAIRAPIELRSPAPMRG